MLVGVAGYVATGRDVHASVNLCRALQGLGYCASPPDVTVEDEGDILSISVGADPPVAPWLFDAVLDWERPGDPPGAPCGVMIWSLPAANRVKGVPPESRARWVCFAPIEVGVPVHLGSLADWGGLLVSPGAAVLRLGLAEVGLPPFVERWVQCENSL